VTAGIGDDKMPAQKNRRKLLSVLRSTMRKLKEVLALCRSIPLPSSQVNEMFAAAVSALSILVPLRKGRKRRLEQIRWTPVAREMRQAKLRDNEEQTAYNGTDDEREEAKEEGD